MRQFGDGGCRDDDDGKFDYEGFFDPEVLLEFARYMHKHRQTADGLRGSDNWQKGMPRDQYMKSLLRHVVDLWLLHRDKSPVRPETGEHVRPFDALGGILFNVQGYWHEMLEGR